MSDVLNKNEYLEGDETVEIVELDDSPFEIIGELEHEGDVYLALIPYVEDSEDESSEESDEIKETEFVILKESEEDGENYLVTVDDSDLYQKIGNIFLNLFKEET